MSLKVDNIPEFGREPSKHIFVGSNTIGQVFFAEHGRNVFCLGRARSSTFVSAEHNRVILDLGRAHSKHTDFWLKLS